MDAVQDQLDVEAFSAERRAEGPRGAVMKRQGIEGVRDTAEASVKRVLRLGFGRPRVAE
jgi:hypothetical protein